jgi:hypothetical protein
LRRECGPGLGQQYDRRSRGGRSSAMYRGDGLVLVLATQADLDLHGTDQGVGIRLKGYVTLQGGRVSRYTLEVTLALLAGS